MSKLDYIDTSVYLGMVFEQGENPWKYLRVVGYKNKNKGLISEYVLGEILNNILLKVEDENPRLELEEKKRALEIIDKVIRDKEKANSLKVSLFLQKINFSILSTILSLDRNITQDDALHLTVAIHNNCQNFVTMDKTLYENEILKSYLRRNHNLKFKEITNN